MADIVKYLKNEINRLNEKNPFFKDLCFDVDMIKDRSKNDDCAGILSRKCPNLYFWIDCFEKDKNKKYINRFCFAYQIPSFLPNSLLEKVIPKDWWLGSEEHLTKSYYNKIIFEIDCIEKDEGDYFKKFHNGNEAEATDISNLKKDSNSYPDRYLAFYPKQKNGEVKSLEDFKKLFKKFNELWENIMKIANENVAKALLLDKRNIILQGAPGTGKTYSTAALALSIVNPNFTDFSDHDKVMEEYKKLLIKFDKDGHVCNDGLISFVTFHQSMDYEDFVEGIKPKVVSDKTLNKKIITYEIENGIFKQICLIAKGGDKKDIIDNFLNDCKEKKKNIFGEKKTNPFVVLKYSPDTKNIRIKPERTQETSLDLDIFTNGVDYEMFTKKIKTSHEYAKVIQKSKTKRKSSSYTNNYQTKYYFGLHKEFFEYVKTHKIDLSSLKSNKSLNYVLIIDEINRGNVSKILGELISLLEVDKRIGGNHPLSVTLPYSKESFSVPSNLYIIGTMNTTDRSVGSIDYAVRRRFAFVTLKANKDLIQEDDARDLFDAVNNFLDKSKYDMNIEDLMVGHSYFMDSDNLQMKWQYEILPLLMEYYKDGIIRKSPLNDKFGNEIKEVKENYTVFISEWLKNGTKETKA